MAEKLKRGHSLWIITIHDGFDAASYHVSISENMSQYKVYQKIRKLFKDVERLRVTCRRVPA